MKLLKVEKILLENDCEKFTPLNSIIILNISNFQKKFELSIPVIFNFQWIGLNSSR